MKKFALFCCLITSFVSAQNNYIGRHLNLPVLPAPNWKIASADFQHDGYPEIVTTDQLNGRVIIYPNTSGVVDSVPAFYSGPSATYSIVDWNHDGWMDLAIVNHQTINISIDILINNSGNGFLSPSSLTNSSPFNQYEYNFMDLNSDSFPDLYYTKSGVVYIALNNGGGFSVTEQSTGLSASTYQFGDFNGDNLMDIVSLQGPYAILYQNTGSFQYTDVDTVAFTNGSTNLWKLAVYDLNNDGIPEVLVTTDWQLYVASRTSGFLFNQFYTANFQFQEINEAVLSTHNGFSDWSDVDGNGYKDVVIANSVFFVYAGLAITRADILAQPDYGAPYVRAMDTNNDGVMELWWNLSEYVDRGDPRIFSEHYASGTSFSAKQALWTPNFIVKTSDNNPYRDFDGDGDPDFIYQSPGRVIMAVNDGSGHFTEQVVITGYWWSFFILDVDHDGLPDIIGQSNASPHYYYVYHNNGNMHFTLQGGAITSGSNYYLADADFDNDGYDDVLFKNLGGASSYRLEIFQNVAGTLTSRGIIYTHVGYSGTTGDNDVYVTDMNRDGKKDVLFSFSNGVMGTIGQLACVFNQGNFAFTTTADIGYASYSDHLAGCSDVNGDGRQDLIISSHVGNMYYLPCTPTGFGGAVNMGIPVYGDHYQSTDANDDGNNDLIMLPISPGTFNVALNTGNSFGPAIGNGSPIENPANCYLQAIYGDFDSDGDIDLFFPHGDFWLENTAISTSRINGKVFYDVNGNGIQDPGDVGVENFPVQTSPIAAAASTDNNGRFSMRMGSAFGTYAVRSASAYNGSFTFTTLPYPDSATVLTTAPVDSVKIGFNSPGGIHQVLLDQAVSHHRCNSLSTLWINTVNLSPLTSNYKLELSFPSPLAYLNASQTPTTIVGNQYTWNFPASAFQVQNLWLDMMMPGPQFTGDTIQFISRLTSIQATDTIISIDTLPVVLNCAIDPNEKLLMPMHTELAWKDTVNLFDDYVEYQVNFQNTGNDTAQTVVIMDHLPASMNPMSARLISSSFPADFAMDQAGHLTATLSHINLPDSTTDYTGSMGYIKFSAQLKPAATHNFLVYNSAEIYFDQNPPVITDTCMFRRLDCKVLGKPNISAASYCSGSGYPVHVNPMGSDAAYDWYFDSVFVSNADTAFLQINRTGNHTLEVMVDLAVCHSDSVYTFNVTHAPPVITLNAAPHQGVCPGDGLLLISNIPVNFYHFSTLADSNAYNYYASIGDSITAQATNSTAPYCSAYVYTVISEIYHLPLPLLTDTSAVQLHKLNGCDNDTNTYTSTMANTIWNWTMGTASGADTSQHLSLWFNPLYGDGTLTMRFDSLGCSYYEQYAINVAGNSSPLPLDTGRHLVNCAPNWPYLFYTTSRVDSILEFQNSVYLRKLRANFPVQLTDTGVFTYQGYSAGCPFAPLTIHVRDSQAPFAEILATTGMLYTSDGSQQDWYYSSSGTGATLLSHTDTIHNPFIGYYYLSAEWNADSCRRNSPLYYFDPTGISTVITVSNLLRYDDNTRTLYIEGEQLPDRFEMYDQTGRMVFDGPARHSNLLPSLSQGIYMARILSKNTMQQLKFMVTHE